MKKKFIVIGIILAVLLVGGILKNQIIKSTVTVVATQVTGAPTTIDSLSLGLFNQRILIKGFKMYNPKGFDKQILINIPTIEVAYDLGALLKRKLHFRKIELNLSEIGVTRNKEGELNINALKVSQQDKKEIEKKAEEKPAQKKESPELAMQIDELILSVGKVVYRDHTTGNPPPSVQVYDIGIERKVYRNIGSAAELMAVMMTEPMKKTAIQGAKLYAASAILGAGFLPAGVAITLVGKDSTLEEFNVPLDQVYATTIDVIKKTGKIKSEIKKDDTSVIKALINKVDVTIKIEKKTPKTSMVTISARKFFLPKPEIAGGVLLQIAEKLK